MTVQDARETLELVKKDREIMAQGSSHEIQRMVFERQAEAIGKAIALMQAIEEAD